MEEFSVKNAQRFEKEYSEDRFWDKIKRHASKAGAEVVYIALLLYYAMVSGDSSLSNKGRIVGTVARLFGSKTIRNKSVIIGALGYLILPVDVVPDLLPFLGYSDDLMALILAYKAISDSIDDAVRSKAQSKVRELFGDVDETVFDVCRTACEK
ncbi:MAG: DUF1232 domain-containing protein [Bacteroidales bacterium]|nr:DUF1232 domain-containing protein [Bacteroidales bacterium]